MVNMENSAGDFNREKGKVLVSAKNSNQDEQTSDFMFQHFHEQYLKLKSLTSSNSEGNSRGNSESRILLEYMIEELSKRIKSSGEKHEYFYRLLGMKIFLQHILSKVLDENESRALLEKLYKESKPYLSNPEVAYSGFLVINSLSALKGKLENSLEKVRDILEECQISYTQLKSTDKDDNCYSGNELFSSEKKMLSNKDAKLKYEKLVVTNLLFLGSIYEKLGDHYKDIVCYHTAFNRMLNKGLVSPFKWVDFTTRLACVFIDDNNFKDARHHLSAATHVHEMLEVRNSSISDPIKEELIKSNSIHLALAWVRYCVLLFEKSKDEDRRKFSSLFKNGYLYSNNRPIEKSIINEQYKSNFLSDRNSTLQNKVFMETINNEISDECDDYDKISNPPFENFLDVLKCHLNETKEKEHNEIKKPEINDSETNKNMNEEHKTNSQDPANDNLNKKHEPEDNSESKVIIDEANEKQMTKECENNKGETEIEKFDSINKENIKETDQIEESDGKEKKENELIFSSLGYLPIEQAVTKDLIQTPEQAKKLFTFAYRWSKQAQLFYPKTSDFYSYVHVILNLVSLHRLCAYFQGRDNLDYRINLEQTRENLLEHLVTELSEIQPENHLHVRLYQEMALLNIDLAMLNMCNIYNIHADDTYKLFAFAEIQSHINHIYIVGDMLERSTNIFEKKKTQKKSSEEKTDLYNISAS